MSKLAKILEFGNLAWDISAELDMQVQQNHRQSIEEGKISIATDFTTGDTFALQVRHGFESLTWHKRVLCLRSGVFTR